MNKEPLYDPQQGDFLVQLIKDPKNNLLTKAEKNEVFLLASDTYGYEFISLWELYDHPEHFKRCVEVLTQKTLSLKNDFGFNYVVSITDTSKELIRHTLPKLNDALEQNLSSSVRHSHFDDFPYSDSSIESLSFVEGEKVLIITDVVASGKLVRSLYDRIIGLGGNPVACLSVVVTGEDYHLGHVNPSQYDMQSLYLSNHIDKLTEQSKEENWRIVKNLYRIAEYGISYQKRDEVSETNVVEIDPVSVVPKRHVKLPDPSLETFGFTTRQFIQDHLSQNLDIADYGIFRAEDHLYTIFFNIKKMLEEPIGPMIWQKIEGQISGDVTLVSTFSREDILLRDFIIERSSSSETCSVTRSMVIKRSVHDTPYFSLSIGKDTRFADDEHIVLTLSTLSTSDKLKNIISLLRINGAANITVICLFNRMGIYTNYFINKLMNIFKENTKFQFFPVYNYQDIDINSLKKFDRKVRSLIGRYTKFTKVHHFKSLAVELKNLLLGIGGIQDNRSDRMNLLDQPISIKVPNSLNHNDKDEIDFAYDNGIAFLLSFHFSTTDKNYDLLRDLIVSDDIQSEMITYLTRVILINLDAITQQKKLGELQLALIAKIKEYRLKRFDEEKAFLDSLNDAGKPFSEKQNVNSFFYEDLSRIYANELSLILTFTLILSLGKKNLTMVENDFIFQLMDHPQGKSWEKHPLNFKLTFENERLFFYISIILVSCVKDFGVADKATVAKEKLTSLKKDVMKLTKEIEEDHFKKLVTAPIIKGLEKERKEPSSEYLLENVSPHKVNIILDFINTEAGKYDFRRHSDIIRFLHRSLLKDKPSDVFSPIDKFNNSIVEHFNKKNTSEDTNVSLSSEDLFNSTHATRSLSTIYLIGSVIKKFYGFHWASFEQSQRYLEPETRPGFLSDVKYLESVLNLVRNKSEITKLELETIIGKTNTFKDELYFENGFIQNDIKSYIVSIRNITIDSLVRAKKELLNESRIGRLNMVEENLRAASDPGVLSDYNLLNQLIRHIVDFVDHPAIDDTQQVFFDCDIQSTSRPIGIAFKYRVTDVDRTVRNYFDGEKIKCVKPLMQLGLIYSFSISNSEINVTVTLLERDKFI